MAEFDPTDPLGDVLDEDAGNDPEDSDIHPVVPLIPDEVLRTTHHDG